MLTFFYNYVRWHYSAAVTQLLWHLENFLSFLWRFFSLGHLLKTLFAPWSRLSENYRSGIHLKDQAATFAVNTVMRLVGAFVRLVVLCCGVVSLAVGAILAAAVFFLWFLLPAGIVFLIILAVSYV